ncbi:hypothetical protein GCM10028786_30870 [Flaviaesturariibacter terrae]
MGPGGTFSQPQLFKGIGSKAQLRSESNQTTPLNLLNYRFSQDFEWKKVAHLQPTGRARN